jgi:hypothetical protein
MTPHYVDIEFVAVAGGYSAKCSCHGFSKKYPTRDLAVRMAHLHVAGLDVDLIELALAGKEAHA